MQSKPLKIWYIPFVEIVLFILSTLVALVIYFFSNLAPWFIIVLILISYFLTVARATTIKLDNNTLNVISFNPFLTSHTINVKSIIKINSIQIMEHQSDIDFGGYFSRFARKYELEYIDDKGNKKKAHFSFINRKKEERILNTLRMGTQSDRPIR